MAEAFNLLKNGTHFDYKRYASIIDLWKAVQTEERPVTTEPALTKKQKVSCDTTV
jgi:hypothetical protein